MHRRVERRFHRGQSSSAENVNFPRASSSFLADFTCKQCDFEPRSSAFFRALFFTQRKGPPELPDKERAQSSGGALSKRRVCWSTCRRANLPRDSLSATRQIERTGRQCMEEAERVVVRPTVSLDVGVGDHLISTASWRLPVGLSCWTTEAHVGPHQVAT